MPRFRFFSTKADYEQLASAHEFFSSLYFLQDGQFHSKEIPLIRGLLSLPDLGVINHPHYYHAGPRYWVFPEKPKLRLRSLPPLDDGKKRFTLDGSSLPVCLQFEPFGLWGQDMLICGHMEITYAIGVTRALYRQIEKCFAEEYLKSTYFKEVTYVGRDALALQAKKYRLCANPNLSRSCDFKMVTPSARGANIQAGKARKSTKPQRRSVEETWQFLESEGDVMPRTKAGKPFILPRMPTYDDRKPGFSFFRTCLNIWDMGNLSLPRTFFGRSSFEEVSFRNTDLTQSCMCWNDFTSCDFRGADLSGCDMRASVFEDCNFAGAILCGADLRRSSFSGCDFTKADLTGAIGDKDEMILPRKIAAKQKRSMIWHEDAGPEPPGG
jgi:hypothetical protein